jgi:Terminase RNaseH-like domain
VSATAVGNRERRLDAWLHPTEWPLPRPYQVDPGRAIIDSALEGRGLTFTVMMARQAGKNEISARVEAFLLSWNIDRAVDGVKCAPTLEPQARISQRRLWQRLVQAGYRESLSLEGRAVRLRNARQLFLSAEPSANVVGHTAGLLLEVDEAQDVDAEKFDREFRPMAAATGATIVYYGTPWDDSTLLERAVQTNLELERRDSVKRHFTADWTAVAEFNPAYARYVEGERARLGENHPLFLTQYALKTVSGGGRLFSASQRAQLQGTHARQASPRAGEVYAAGLDLGGQEWGDGIEGDASETRLRGVSTRGHDATVLTIARAVLPPDRDAVVPEPRLEVVEQVAFSGTAHDALFARVADLLGEVWRVRRVAVDATGLGETLARLLMRRLGDEVVRPVRFTAETKSRLGYGLLAAVNGGRLKVYAADGSPEYSEFWREMDLARVHYRPSRQMNFFVAPPDGHDDYLVSLSLAVDAAKGLETTARIARGRIRDDGWT